MDILSYLSVDSIVYGIVSGLLPGLHPIVFPASSPSGTAVMYGLYSSLSILPAVYFKFYSPENAYLSGYENKNAVPEYLAGLLAGLVFVFLYFPFLHLFSLRPPREIVLFVLIATSAFILFEGKRAVFTSALASLFGFLTLKTPLAVSNPLVISVMGLFGGYSLFSKRVEERKEGDFFQGVAAGLVAGALVGYFPAMSVSLALIFPKAFFPGASAFSAVGAATSVSLSVSLFSKLSGVERSAFSAALPENFDLLSVLAFFSFGAVAGALLAFVLKEKIPRFDKKLSISIMALFSFLISGILGTALFFSALLVALASVELGVSYRPLMFYFLAPTLFYYM